MTEILGEFRYVMTEILGEFRYVKTEILGEFRYETHRPLNPIRGQIRRTTGTVEEPRWHAILRPWDQNSPVAVLP